MSDQGDGQRPDRPRPDRPRPDRPQYGEYASADEQVAAGGVPLEPVATHRVTTHQGAPHSVGTGGQLAPPDAATRVEGAAPLIRNWDVTLTLTLLILGAYSVFTSIGGLVHFSATLTQLYAAAGYGDYTSTALADGIGVGILVGQSVIYVVTVALSLARLRARKMAFFVPLAGAALAGGVFFVLVLVAMTSDPALAAWVTNHS